MLLPQSSAFLSLRNRLNAVNSAGFLHIAPKSCVNYFVPIRRRPLIPFTQYCWQPIFDPFETRPGGYQVARAPPALPHRSDEAREGPPAGAGHRRDVFHGTPLHERRRQRQAAYTALRFRHELIATAFGSSQGSWGRPVAATIAHGWDAVTTQPQGEGAELTGREWDTRTSTPREPNQPR